jgi:hypothetical protein
MRTLRFMGVSVRPGLAAHGLKVFPTSECKMNARAGQRLDHVHAVARRRHRADRACLLVGERPIGARQRALEHGRPDHRADLARAADGGGDQSPLGGHQGLAGQPAGDGVHVAAVGEPRAASADLVQAGALRGRRRVLAEHVARSERVGLLGQPAGPAEAIADLALGARAVLADARVGATALQQRIDRRTVQAVLARAGADLLCHVCASTPYCLRSRVFSAQWLRRSHESSSCPTSAAASRASRERVEKCARTSGETSTSSAAPLTTGPHSSPSRSRTSARRCA